jgi:hypothetical protein
MVHRPACNKRAFNLQSCRCARHGVATVRPRKPPFVSTRKVGTRSREPTLGAQQRIGKKQTLESKQHGKLPTLPTT